MTLIACTHAANNANLIDGILTDSPWNDSMQHADIVTLAKPAVRGAKLCCHWCTEILAISCYSDCKSLANCNGLQHGGFTF